MWLGQATSTAVVATQGATITLASGYAMGAKVEIPGAALAQDTTITMEDSMDVMPAPGFDYVAAGPAVRFGPSGTTFASPVTITLPFDPVVVGAAMDMLMVVHRDDSTGVMVLLPPVSVDGALLTLAASSFSTFQPVVATPVNIRSFTTPSTLVGENASVPFMYDVTNASSCTFGAVYCLDNLYYCSQEGTVLSASQGFLPPGVTSIVPNDSSWAGFSRDFVVRLTCQGIGAPVSRTLTINAAASVSVSVRTLDGAVNPADGAAVEAGQPVSLEGDCTNSVTGAGASAYTWDFHGAATNGSNSPFTVTFAQPGMTLVTATCVDSNGVASLPVDFTLDVYKVEKLPKAAPCVPDSVRGVCDPALNLYCNENNICADHCVDLHQNLGETGLDCGGACGVCAPLIGGFIQDHPAGYVNLNDDFCYSPTQPVAHRVFARQDLPGTMNLAAARAACAALPAVPAGSWHVPEAREWAGPAADTSVGLARPLVGGIMDGINFLPNNTLLPGIEADTYWTNSEPGPGEALIINFATAYGSYRFQTESHRVRCVAWLDPAVTCR